MTKNRYSSYGNNWSKVSREVKDKAGNRCTRCGAVSTPGNRLNSHHIIPLSKGGSNSESNLKCICQRCHELEHRHLYAKNSHKHY